MINASARIPFVTSTCNAGNVFRSQCAHWDLKKYMQSVSRPEIPQNFRLTQSFFALKNPWGFQRLKSAAVFTPMNMCYNCFRR